MNDTVLVPVRLDVDALLPDLQRAMGRLDQAATKAADQADLSAGLRHLLKLRASQINGCAYCVDMHTKDARSVGEDDARIVAIPVWRETPFFTVEERGALALLEAVTTMNVDQIPDAVYENATQDLSPEQTAAVLAIAVSINAWNALGVTAHPWEVGSYQP